MMPCNSDGYISYRNQENKEALDKTVRMLCYVLFHYELDNLPPDIQLWKVQHEEIDRLRQMREDKEKELAEIARLEQIARVEKIKALEKECEERYLATTERGENDGNA